MEHRWTHFRGKQETAPSRAKTDGGEGKGRAFGDVGGCGGGASVGTRYRGVPWAHEDTHHRLAHSVVSPHALMSLTPLRHASC